jgi:hypothetical protein
MSASTGRQHVCHKGDVDYARAPWVPAVQHSKIPHSEDDEDIKSRECAIKISKLAELISYTRRRWQ